MSYRFQIARLYLKYPYHFSDSPNYWGYPSDSYAIGKEAWDMVYNPTLYDHTTGDYSYTLWEFSTNRNQAEFEIFFPHINFEGATLDTSDYDIYGPGIIPFVSSNNTWIFNQFLVLLLQKYQCEKLEEMYSE